MPIPVSFTENLILTPLIIVVLSLTFVILTVILPCSVNLIAFPIKFTMICRNLKGSPTNMGGISSSIAAISSRPFFLACTINVPTVESSRSFIEKSIHSSFSCPASIFEKSRISLISVRSESAELLTIPKKFLCSSDNSVSDNSSVIPIIPFIGVLIS